MARLAIIPYLVLPLSTANNESGFQHFFAGPIVNDSADKKCLSIETAAPLGPIQTKIKEERAKLEELAAGVQRASDLAEESGREIDRLTAKAKLMSSDVDGRSQCMDMIRERISREAPMPAADCLEGAKIVLAEAGLSAQWSQFVATNLTNTKGDYSVRQELEAGLKDTEARLQFTRQSLTSAADKRNQLNSELTQNAEKIKGLEGDKASLGKEEQTLSDEESTLKGELQKLQILRFKLESGTLAQEMPETGVQQAIQATPERNRRIDAIKARLPVILAARGKLQVNVAAVLTQIEFLKRSIDDGRARQHALETQIGGPSSGLTKELADLQKQVEEANAKFLKASDAYSFSEYILSALAKKINGLTQDRDAQLTDLKKEQANNASLLSALNAAVKLKNVSWDGLQKEVENLQRQLVNYTDEKHMGWFLELECHSREQIDADKTGVFIGRAPYKSTTGPVKIDGAPVEGGKWGLFNLDYAHFQDEIEKGILLDLPSYIRLAVQQSIKNLDFVIAQSLDSTAQHCGTLGAFNSAIVDLLGSAFAIWNDGSDDQARAKSYCKSEAKQGFVAGLTKFLSFDGSVLDQALPRGDGDEGLERRAIFGLVTEMRTLVSGSPTADPDSLKRRDNLVRSLIRVLAFDYEKAISQMRDFQTKRDYRMATAAPGRSIAPDVASKLTADSVQTVMEQTKLYRLPIAKPEAEAGVNLAVNDQVKILPAVPAGQPVVRAGWVQVKTATGAFWMAASALTATKAGEAPLKSGQAASPGTDGLKISDVKECPLRRLVTVVRGTQLDRGLPPLKPEMYSREGDWRLNAKAGSRITPADRGKTYVACEIFTLPGKPALASNSANYRNYNGVDYTKILGLRIIEVRRVEEGETVRYQPLEDYGGFIQAWFISAEEVRPRLDLGAQLDANWSPVK